MFEEKIPRDTNAFIFEIKRYKARDLKILPTVMKIQRSEVVMQSIVKSSILNNQCRGEKIASNRQIDESAPGPIAQKIFLLNASRLGRMFDLLIGNERVKSANLVNLMLKQSLNPNEEIIGARSRVKKLVLNAKPEHSEFFLKSSHKEPLAINYLQASCFAYIVKNLIKSSPE